MNDTLDTAVTEYVAALGSITDTPGGRIAKVLSTCLVMNRLETAAGDMNSDPKPGLIQLLKAEAVVLRNLQDLQPHLVGSGLGADLTPGAHDRTGELFNEAWTSYSPETYDHSVTLVEKRLRANGFDEAYFAGKRCFDGGCGTGRLSLAMARMGAREVVAVDIGEKSLAYFETVTKRYGVNNITIVRHDVTRLNAWEDGSFDFVSSNGVLHHTPDCLGGLDEHFRITRRGGVLWLYLYGAGGIYWPIYDALRDVIGRMDIVDVKRALVALGLREGLIYTYLDNVLAPRTYHLASEVTNRLGAIAPIRAHTAKGMSCIDDVALSLETPFGAEIFGPEGEVRLVIEKAG